MCTKGGGTPKNGETLQLVPEPENPKDKMRFLLSRITES